MHGKSGWNGALVMLQDFHLFRKLSGGMSCTIRISNRNFRFLLTNGKLVHRGGPWTRPTFKGVLPFSCRYSRPSREDPANHLDNQVGHPVVQVAHPGKALHPIKKLVCSAITPPPPPPPPRPVILRAQVGLSASARRT